MADNKLSESSWLGFIKKHKIEIDDGPLVKALGRFEKTDEDALDRRKTALEDVIDQIKKQAATQARRKKELGDKLFGELRGQLDALMGVAEKALKEVEARAKAGDADEEEASPALLSTKLIPLLRELRKGEATMHALVCLAGKDTAVLVMRRPIAPARRKLLAESIDAKGAAKYIAGECRYENNLLTFILQGSAAGLAKRLRQALLEQTDLRLKVVVRGEDGEERDGEDEGDSESESEGGREASAPPQTPQQTPPPAQPAATGSAPQPQAPIPAPEATGASHAAAYVARRRQLEEQVQAALRSQHPEAAKLRAVCGFADDKAKAQDYAGAHKALDMLERLMDTATASASAAPPAPSTATTAPTTPTAPAAQDESTAQAFNLRLAALMPAIKQALADGGEAAQQIKLKVSEAGALARQKAWDGAGALLDEVEALLAGAGARTGAQQGDDDEEEGEEEDAQAEQDDEQDDDLGDDPEDHTPPPKPRSHIAFTQTRLDWDQARKHVLMQLGLLKSSIVQASTEETDFAEIRVGVDQLYEILEVLDERLIDKLDDALNASGDARASLQREASAIVDEYLDFVSTDALMQDIDRNGFVDLDIQSSLMSRLRRMNEALLTTD